MTEKHKIITRAHANFRDVHPTPSAGKKFKGDDLPAHAGSDGKESVYVNCKQCGFYVKTDRDTKGSGYGNETATDTEQTHPITGATVYYADPTVNAGCPMCGSSEYE